MSDDRLRDQLVSFVDWGEAHVDFDKSLDGIPADQRGVRAPGIDHTIWQLLEHMRLAQQAGRQEAGRSAAGLVDGEISGR